jgi:hypothetical protein
MHGPEPEDIRGHSPPSLLLSASSVERTSHGTATGSSTMARGEGSAVVDREREGAALAHIGIVAFELLEREAEEENGLTITNR